MASAVVLVGLLLAEYDRRVKTSVRQAYVSDPAKAQLTVGARPQHHGSSGLDSLRFFCREMAQTLSAARL
jgi:hypothetical protein